jgi:hypothetical protein
MIKVHDKAYLIESNMKVREVWVSSVSGGLYLVRFIDSDGAIRVRENRLYATKEEAEAALPKKPEVKKHFLSPYDYDR